MDKLIQTLTWAIWSAYIGMIVGLLIVATR